jgi:hypothetical protein
MHRTEPTFFLTAVLDASVKNLFGGKTEQGNKSENSFHFSFTTIVRPYVHLMLAIDRVNEEQ